MPRQTNQTMTLPISEMFCSIQGEGPTAGTPAIFLRLKGCNLSCGGPTTIQTKHLESGATWRCDTIEVWTKGDHYLIEDIISSWKNNGWENKLKQGAHLIITGGEPLLHEKGLIKFLSLISNELKTTVEIETNGTLCPSNKLDKFITQYNISPKLQNSGMTQDQRINSKTLDFFSKSQKSIFKFVLSKKEDINEIQTKFQTPFNISSNKIFLMPASNSRKSHQSCLPLISKLCIDHGYKLSPRLQLIIWDKTTGV